MEKWPLSRVKIAWLFFSQKVCLAEGWGTCCPKALECLCAYACLCQSVWSTMTTNADSYSPRALGFHHLRTTALFYRSVLWEDCGWHMKVYNITKLHHEQREESKLFLTLPSSLLPFYKHEIQPSTYHKEGKCWSMTGPLAIVGNPEHWQHIHCLCNPVGKSRADG